jgi:hypothetical protein
MGAAGVTFTRRMTDALWRYMPFADLRDGDVRLRQLLRLSLFQISVGMVQTLFFGTLNRVMIVELGVSAALVSVFIAIPLLVAPFRALVGFRSDTHRSVLGWRRVPFILMGTLLQFGGLAIMPFALLAFADGTRPHARVIGYVASGLAFFLTGAGAHTTQTAGLALATDLAPDRLRPRVIALMYLTMLVGNVVSAFLLGGLLHAFTPQRLIEVVQGCALVTAVFNGVALWKQEARVPGSVPYRKGERRPLFREAWRVFTGGGRPVRLLTRWRSASSPSTCRTCCSSRTAARSCACRWGRPPGSTGVMAAARSSRSPRRRGCSNAGSTRCGSPRSARRGRVRVRDGDLRRPARLGAPLPRRHRAHRLRRGQLRRRHPLGGDGAARPVAARHSARRLGRGVRHGRGDRALGERRDQGRALRARGRRRARRGAVAAERAVQRRVPPRDPRPVRDARRARAARVGARRARRATARARRVRARDIPAYAAMPHAERPPPARRRSPRPSPPPPRSPACSTSTARRSPSTPSGSSSSA